MVEFAQNMLSPTPNTGTPRWVWLVIGGVLVLGVIGLVVVWRYRLVAAPAPLNTVTETTPVALPTEENSTTVQLNDTLATEGEPTNDQTATGSMELDSDDDGLPDAVEIYIGSNPIQADSDGDGYTDGEEVRNGYDPLGPGTFTFTL